MSVVDNNRQAKFYENNTGRDLASVEELVQVKLIMFRQNYTLWFHQNTWKVSKFEAEQLLQYRNYKKKGSET